MFDLLRTRSSSLDQTLFMFDATDHIYHSFRLPLLPAEIPEWVASVQLPPSYSPATLARVIELLRPHPSVESVYLERPKGETPAVDLEPIASCSRLSKFTLRAYGRDVFEEPLGPADPVVNLRPLAKLTGLRELDLGCRLDDIAPLADLPQLESLSLSRFTQNRRDHRLRVLATLANLKQLSIHSPGTIDLAALVECPSLRSLSIRHADLVSLEPLRELLELEELEIEFPWCPMPKIALAPLSALVHLRHLTVRNAHLLDLEPLRACTELRRLAVSGGWVGDIGALAACSRIEQVDLSDSPVSDITALGGLEHLRAVNLRCTRVTDLSPLRDCRLLEFCDLDDTELEGCQHEIAGLGLLPAIQAGLCRVDPEPEYYTGDELVPEAAADEEDVAPEPAQGAFFRLRCWFRARLIVTDARKRAIP